MKAIVVYIALETIAFDVDLRGRKGARMKGTVYRDKLERNSLTNTSPKENIYRDHIERKSVTKTINKDSVTETGIKKHSIAETILKETVSLRPV